MIVARGSNRSTLASPSVRALPGDLAFASGSGYRSRPHLVFGTLGRHGHEHAECKDTQAEAPGHIAGWPGGVSNLLRNAAVSGAARTASGPIGCRRRSAGRHRAAVV